MTKVFLTPGPTEIHPVAKECIQNALNTGIAAISHRSKEYEKIQIHTDTQLRKLLGVPKDYKIFFLGSGTEAWERIIQNVVKKKSLHLINGAFSRRFFETAQELNKAPVSLERPLGQGFELKDLPDQISEEAICLTHNETSTGVCLETGFIEKLQQNFSDKLIAVDAVSSAPYPKTDLQCVDCYFFSVQKFFSLPAGLGVLIVSPRALERSEELKKQGQSVGAHHSFASLSAFSDKHQTPTTPNVLMIHTLGKIAEYFNQAGIDKIRAETESKAQMIYKLLDNHEILKPFVGQPQWRSQTVITVDSGNHTNPLLDILNNKGLVLGQGYGKLKDSQFRIANFAAHTPEMLQNLCTELRNFKP